jgi:hypothetical protein
MNFYFFIYQALVTIADFLGLGLGILVLRKNLKDPQNQFFFLMVLFALSWITFAFLSDLPSQFHNSLLWNRLIFFSLSLFFVSIYFFGLYFPQKISSRFDVFNKIYALFGISIALLSLFTPTIIKDVRKTEWGTDLIWGPLFLLFMILGMSWFIPLGLIIKKFFRLSPLEKLKIKYFLVGFSIFIAANTIFNAILPPIRGTYKYYWFGNLSILIFLGCTAYSILAKQLFEIKVILTEALIGILGIILLTQAILALTLEMKILGFIVFSLFCFIGYLLIRYTHQEIHQKEILEEKVKERTKELENAYQQLEKAKEELEKAYNQVLIEKDKFERLYKATLGREMRIIELKEEVRKLKEEIEKLKGKREN